MTQRFQLLLTFCLFLACFPVAAKVLVHTDNAHDMTSFNLLSNRSLSSETNILALGLPNPQLKLELVPLKRSLRFMSEGQPVCVINKIQTKQRAENFLFSKPINVFLNRRLYHLANIDTQGVSEPINLMELFAAYPARRLIFSDQLSYGDDLDSIIKQLPDKNKMVRRGALQGRGMVDMFVEQRGEYALFHPYELLESNLSVEVKSYEIAGIEPYVVGRLMCAKTQQTQQFINNVNKRIDALNIGKRLQQAHLDYYDVSIHVYLTQYLATEFSSN